MLPNPLRCRVLKTTTPSTFLADWFPALRCIDLLGGSLLFKNWKSRKASSAPAKVIPSLDGPNPFPAMLLTTTCHVPPARANQITTISDGRCVNLRRPLVVLICNLSLSLPLSLLCSFHHLYCRGEWSWRLLWMDRVPLGGTLEKTPASNSFQRDGLPRHCSTSLKKFEPESKNNKKKQC